MKVYIAGSSQELRRASRALEIAEKLGLEVVSTWVSQIKLDGNANPIDFETRRACSDQDLAEVRDCDVLWLLVPLDDRYSHGAFVEYGYAAACNKIIVSSGPTVRSIFCSLGHEFGADAEAARWIQSLHGDKP